MRLIPLLFLLLAGVTVWGNYKHLSEYLKACWHSRSKWEGRPYCSVEYPDEARELINLVPPGAELVLLTDLSKGLSPICRMIHLGMSWAMSPDRVVVADTVEGVDDSAYILLSRYSLSRFDRPPGKYTRVRSVGAATLWHKAPPTPLTENPARNVTVPRWREAMGLLAPVAVFAGGMLLAGWTGALLGVLLFTLGMVFPPTLGVRPAPWFVVLLVWGAVYAIRLFRDRLHSDPGPLSRVAVARMLVGGGVVLGVLAVLTLGHTFFPPNGLGVFGGKARLLYLAPGLPPGFFTDAAHATLQPAYPPGFALLTLGCYGLAGGCGEYLTQLLGCLCMAGVAVFLVRFARSWWCVVWIVSAFFTTQILQVGSLFYAEPLMALMALAGWERLRTGRNDLGGWLLLGAAGWIKNEGILILPACWLAVRVLAGRQSASIPCLLAGLALPLVWHVGCRLAGGGLYDYASPWQPDVPQAVAAVKHLFKIAFREPWRYGCVYPLMLAGWLLPSLRTRAFAVVNVTAILQFVAFIGIFSLSRAGDFEWHLDSMERLLWLPALLLLRELVNVKQNAISSVSRAGVPEGGGLR